jgi:predicted metal-dependent phosphoesterase TrpH
MAGSYAAPGPPKLSIAQVFPVRRGGTGEAARFAEAASEELERRGHEVLRVKTGDPVKRLLKGRDLDVVHVHDPFAPSAASAALRHSFSLNVATFHDPRERVLATQVARPLVEIFFGRIDARTVTRPQTAELLERYFPAGYEVLRIVTGEPVKRLLKGRDLDVVHVHEPFAPSVSSAALRHSYSLNVATFHAPQERVLSTQVARPLVEIFFGRIDARTVASEATGELIQRYFPGHYELLAPGADGDGWGRVADEAEAIYRRLLARRHPQDGDPEIRERISQRPLIEVDLHMHTDHSGDCATPVDVLIQTARDRGLGAIAITDHNEVSGALEARKLAEELGDIKVIVAEEVKTAEQGEVIGLFLEEKIPKGLTMAETIAEIRRQGGLVYVPHPFDRFHSVPDYEHLLDIVEEIDILEVFNPRVALTSFNKEAVRFAAKYRIVSGAGSDSHVAQGLGSVRQRIHDFDGPAEFLEAMRDADITRKHKNLVYVQTLKFLQTTGRPKAPKRRVPDAKPVRGGRPRRRGEGRRASKS